MVCLASSSLCLGRVRLLRGLLRAFVSTNPSGGLLGPDFAHVDRHAALAKQARRQVFYPEPGTLQAGISDQLTAGRLTAATSRALPSVLILIYCVPWGRHMCCPGNETHTIVGLSTIGRQPELIFFLNQGRLHPIVLKQNLATCSLRDPCSATA